jgi:hypothetical protein
VYAWIASSSVHRHRGVAERENAGSAIHLRGKKVVQLQYNNTSSSTKKEKKDALCE